YYSLGAKPIPDSIIGVHDNVFFKQTVTLAPPDFSPPAGAAPVNTGSNPNALSWPSVSLITLPNIHIRLDRPTELMLWPLLWELPLDNDLDATQAALAPAARSQDYATAQFTQGANLTWDTHANFVIRHTSAGT